jgi:capsular polysaccharide export protein
LRISKYNDAPPRSLYELGLDVGRPRVLVIDQTYGDAAIAGASADETSFNDMLAAAIAENPGHEIVVKVHPETIAGKKRGYLDAALEDRRVTVISMAVEPASLLEAVDKVYTVSSLLGFEALLWDREVVCFGQPFYAGWGLTDDRKASARGAVSREQLFHAAYIRYCHYLDAWLRQPIAFETAVEQIAFLKQRFLENGPSICLGMTLWKRPTVARFLDGVGGKPQFVGRAPAAIALAKRKQARLVAWAARETPGLQKDCEYAGVALHRMEDGFLRSVGLGASFVAPASLIIDERGIYYDPTRPSGFEALAETTEFTPELLARAALLREAILAAGLSKYNEGRAQSLALPREPYRVLVPGQVEDDASIRKGARRIATNLDLLKAVRARHPGAVVIYKPHPDVEAGLRKGGIAAAETARLADAVVRDIAMPALLDQVDRVETMTSLTGFEALLRGKPVAVHGQPFFAGWGLTEDLDPVERRRRILTLDQLVALTLILYPRYCDPVSGRLCPPEVIVERLRRQIGKPQSPMRRAVRMGMAWSIHNLLLPVAKRFR